MNKKQEELKPCPFCGKDVAVFSDAKELEDCANYEDEDCSCKNFHPNSSCPYICVVCDVNKGGCGASSGYSLTREKVAEKWNRRQ